MRVSLTNTIVNLQDVATNHFFFLQFIRFKHIAILFADLLLIRVIMVSLIKAWLRKRLLVFI